jgi:acyl-CoA synthetase (AMP-forming)/AMP-acid ligase II
MNIADTLLQRTAELGERAAIIDVHRGQDRTYSFHEFERATASVAAQFSAAGLKQGDGVLLLHPVAVELYLVLVALFRIGCVAVFLDPSAGRAHVERCCSIFSPKAFFGSRRAHLLRWTIPALRRVPLAFCTEWFLGSKRIDPHGEAKPADHVVSLPDDAPALITFTSGSTGQPKAALRTHGFLLAQHRTLKQSLKLEPGKCDLTTLPIFVLANLGSGVTSVLPDADLRFPGAVDPQPVLTQIRRHGIQSTAASPAFMSRILSECEKTDAQITELERVYLGGAPVFPGVLHKTKRFCPQAAITAVYGSTEAEPMAEIALDDISPEDFFQMQKGKGLLAGTPVPSISLRVIQDQWGRPIAALNNRQFEQLRVPIGEAGEIVVSGAHVLPGYLHGEGDAETKFDVEGTRWHRTGDLGYFDERGRLWLLGRCSAKIRDERGTLYPFAVECAAVENTSVNRAAVVSISGLRVLAIETEKPVSSEEVQNSLPWAELDRVVAMDRIPVDKRHNAKIDYVKLAGELAKVIYK